MSLLRNPHKEMYYFIISNEDFFIKLSAYSSIPKLKFLILFVIFQINNICKEKFYINQISPNNSILDAQAKSPPFSSRKCY